MAKEEALMELLAEMKSQRDEARAWQAQYLGELHQLAALLDGKPEAVAGASIKDALTRYVRRLEQELAVLRGEDVPAKPPDGPQEEAAAGAVTAPVGAVAVEACPV